MGMTMVSVEEEVRRLVFERTVGAVAAEQIPNDASLRDELGIDSLGMVELLLAIEEKFVFTIPDEDLIVQEDWMSSVETLTAYVSRRL